MSEILISEAREWGVGQFAEINHKGHEGTQRNSAETMPSGDLVFHWFCYPMFRVTQHLWEV